ncbi:FmdB family zinc ribbon protein [Chloroflexota bacterium]
MPIYEYECGHCCFRFEMKQSYNEEPETVCPQCQGRTRRVFHATPIIFKGSGFYITDSRKNKGNGSEKSKGKLAGKQEQKGTESEKNKGDSVSKQEQKEK